MVTTQKLTALGVKALSAPGLYSDGGGLNLRIAPGGSKRWVLRLQIDGKRRDLGLGGFPAVSLANARRKAESMREIAADGRDPMRPKTAVPAFKEAALAVHAQSLPGWRNGKHTDQWIKTLELYAFPTLGRMRLDRIDRGDVIAVLLPIWTSKPETARRVRQRIRTVLRWAMAHGFVETNVAGEAIEGALPVHRQTKSHFRALPYTEIAASMARIESSQAWPCSKFALSFAIFTAARSGEVRFATWAEIDRERKTWTIPAERMKARREHRVPLSGRALAILDRAWAFRDASGLVFPSSRCKAMSDNTISKLMRELEIEGTPHGFRSSFRDWCAETGKQRELAEAALAHIVGGVEGAYFRSDLFEARRALMDQWASFLMPADAESRVVPLYG